MKLKTENDLYDIFFKELDKCMGDIVFPAWGQLNEVRIKFSDAMVGHRHMDILFDEWRDANFEHVEGWRKKK